MKKGQKLWTEEELVLTINLYFKTPFGKLHKGNPVVIQLAELIGRTPSAVAYKLVNFASLDSSLQERGIKGAKNTSKLDKISTNCKILICSDFLKSSDSNIEYYFKKYHNQEIILPTKFLPSKAFLEYHNDEKFRR